MKTIMLDHDTVEVWRSIQRVVGGLEIDGVPGHNTARAVYRKLTGKDWGEASPARPGQVPLLPIREEFDDRTEANLATLDPAVQDVFRRFVRSARDLARANGLDYIVISGTRSWAEQDALYAKGRTAPGKIVTNARGGYSNHNFGIAIDGGVFRSGRYLDGSGSAEDRAIAAEFHRRAGRLAKLLGLKWGGDWQRFPDPPHIEYDTGLTLAEMRARVAAGESVV